MEQKIAASKEILRQIRQTLLRIPVREAIFTAHAEGDYSPELSGRLGQQMLASVLLEGSVKKQEQALEEAINLLSLGASAKHAFWLDILQAKKLLLDLPKAELTAFNEAEQKKSFFLRWQQMSAKLKELLQQIRQKKVAMERPLRRKGGQPPEPIEHLFAEELTHLNELLRKVQASGLAGRQLQAQFNLYQDRYKELCLSYEAAVKEGSLYPNGMYQSELLNLFKRKVKQAQNLKERAETLSNQMVQSCKKMESVLKDLNALCQKGAFSLSDLDLVGQRFGQFDNQTNTDVRFINDLEQLFEPEFFIYP